MPNRPETAGPGRPADNLAKALEEALTLCPTCGRQADPTDLECPACGMRLRGTGVAGELRTPPMAVPPSDRSDSPGGPTLMAAEDKAVAELEAFIRDVARDLGLTGTEAAREAAASRNAQANTGPIEKSSIWTTWAVQSKGSVAGLGIALVGVLVYVAALVSVLPTWGAPFAAVTIALASVLIVSGGMIHGRRRGARRTLPEGPLGGTASRPRPDRSKPSGPSRGSGTSAGSSTITCPMCDEELPTRAKFCMSCGAQMGV